MSEDVNVLIQRLRGEYRIPITDGLGPVGGSEPNNPNEFVRHFETPPIQHESATLIEQQAARIAELESERDTAMTDCHDRLADEVARAEAAEAEVKRRGIALELIAQHHGQCITEPPRLACDDPRAAYQEGSNQAFNKLAKIALDALAPQEPRRD